MLPAMVVALYVPALIWMLCGLALLIAFRRSAPRVVLRLAATFLALWALLATTTLIWVLTNGGYSAIVTLARQPLTLFEPRWAVLWALGALGAFVVFAIAFSVNQLVGRGFLHILRPATLAWPANLPRPAEAVRLMQFHSFRPEAFSFTLLAVGGGARAGPHRVEVILLADELLRRLEPEEVEATIAHELGHIYDLDGRYLTFFRTLARMMRWDPLLAHLANSLTRQEEYRADDAAVAMTGRPLALARALFKASTLPRTSLPPGMSAFLGTSGRRGAAETIRRIERLVQLAERSGSPSPEGA
ncbi:MAG: M48 family metalloprotease [Thermoplasmata archaeon]|nr:M48 family metalloprotease [Thermoplasmata archaeon]